MSGEPKSNVPKWLSELQQRSWEPEILLSGIVLYGMFKVPNLLDGFLAYFKLNIFGNSQDIDNLVALSKMGIYWLITGLILHLICRGIWIGMVGLSYTFPEGIRFDKLNYKERFKQKVERTPTYEQIVIRLEKVSSSLFSVSFMLFMSLIGGYLFFFSLLILPFTILYVYFGMSNSGLLFELFQYYVLVVLTLGLVSLVDFLSLGYFRKFKFFAKVFWPIHKLTSILTLSRFYRPIYYGMVTNFNKWVFFLFLAVFTFVSIAGASRITDTTYPGDRFSQIALWGTSRGYSAYSGYYDDQNDEFQSMRSHIQSDVVTGDVLRLFIVADVSTEEAMLKRMSLDSLQEVYPDTISAALKLMIVKDFYELLLDGERVESSDMYFHYKARTKQRGYLTYIDISDIDEGLHRLTLKGPGERFSYPYAVIPFYRDITYSSGQTPKRESEENDADFQPKPFGVR